MSSVNKVILIGNLGADPELRYTQGGGAICNIRMATTETWKDKTSGERRESTEWHKVVLYRKLAEVANQYLKKGSQIYVEGMLKTRKWQDKQGADRYSTEIEVTEMTMLGKNSAVAESTSPAPSDANRVASKKESYGFGQAPAWLDVDTIPF